MKMRSILATLRHGTVWAVVWGMAALTVQVVMRVAGAAGAQAPWGAILGLAARFAVIGGVSGVAFAVMVRAAWRGQQLSRISWWRFGLGGGAATALFLPCFLSVMRLLTGDSVLPLEYWLPNMTVGALFGTLAAGGTVRVAQLAAGREDAAIRAGSAGQMLPAGSYEDNREA